MADASGIRLLFKRCPFVLAIASIGTGALAYWDAYEWFYHHSRQHEAYNYDEIVAFMTLFLVIGLLWLSWCLYKNAINEAGSRKKAEARLARLNIELEARIQDRTARLREELHERQRMQTQLVEKQEQLQALSTELSIVQEQERHRIAADLHDNIGQALALANNQFVVLRSQMSSPSGRQLVDDISALIKDCISYSRSLVTELNCPLFYSLSFPSAMEYAARDLLEKSGIALHVQIDGEIPKLPEKPQIVLCKAIQESLVNIIKHAEAQNVEIRFHCEDTSAVVEIQDDGIGFDVATLADPAHDVRSGSGIFMNRERLAYLKGYLRIASKPGAGTLVSMAVPFGKQVVEHPVCL